eukprot:gene14710-biopygen14205
MYAQAPRRKSSKCGAAGAASEQKKDRMKKAQHHRLLPGSCVGPQSCVGPAAPTRGPVLRCTGPAPAGCGSDVWKTIQARTAVAREKKVAHQLDLSPA